MPHVHTDRDIYNLSAELSDKQERSEKGIAGGYASLGVDGKIPVGQLPDAQGGAAWGDVSGTLSDQTDLQSALDGKAASDHNHDSAYAALSHTHTIANVTNLQTSLDGKSASGHNHAGVYEPADAAIQTHIQAAHAPSNAQKNSDITKAEIEAKLTGEISSHTHAAGPGGEAFPVGSVFIAVVSTDPATLLGYGTWSAIAAGRMLIGLNAGDSDFDTLEETGGAKTHTLTTAQIPAHTHVQDPHTHVQNSHTHDFLPRSATTGAVSSIVTGTLDTSSTISGANQPHVQAATATNQNATAVNQNAGGGQAHPIMNPYFVVKIWKRTA